MFKWVMGIVISTILGSLFWNWWKGFTSRLSYTRNYYGSQITALENTDTALQQIVSNSSFFGSSFGIGSFFQTTINNNKKSISALKLRQLQDEIKDLF